MMRLALLVIVFLITVSAQVEDEPEEVPSTHMPHLLSTPSLIEATIGEEVTFPCDVDDLGDFVLLWKKGKMLVLFAGDLRVFREDRYKLVDKSSLRISSVHPKDSGEYICQISSNPPIELSHTLDVLYPPSVEPRPKEGLITVKEGETVSLSCDATGNPEPTISWRHANRIYNEGNEYHINSAQKSHSGEYECIADNSVGEPAIATITVEVVSAPKVHPNPKDGLLVVKEGEKISISCETSGDPMPVITWKKPGGDKPQKVREGNKIVISEANRNHAGSYECIANNSLGISTSAIIKVKVLYPPEVHVPNTWIHAGEGTNVNISCIVRGEPLPSVIWKNVDGNQIHPNNHYHIKTNGHLHMLQIRHLKGEDFGRYECIASNTLSSSSVNAHIIGTPQIPHFTSKPHGSQGTKYTISWTVKSHAPVDEYSLMYRKKSSSDEWETKKILTSETKDDEMVHTYMYQILDLTPATSYEAVVTAKNKFGWSKQSEALVFTTKSEAISSMNEEPTNSSSTENVLAVVDEKRSESQTDSSADLKLSFLLVLPLLFSIYYRYLH